jgi:HEAT repeat protein
MRNSVHLNTAQTALSVGDEGRLIAELRSLKSQRSRRGSRAAQAMKILEETNSSRVRNAAALALADLRAHSAKDTLIDLLSQPETRGSRGTLLYALEQLGADVPLPILAEIIVDESYEAREEALALIVSNRIEFSGKEFACSKARLEAARASADAERLQAIRRALEAMEINHDVIKNVRR